MKIFVEKSDGLTGTFDNLDFPECFNCIGK